VPRVSVILTSFNHAAYLNESIDSVLGQTFADLELIVLDDASRDNSWSLISRYEDRRLRAYLSATPGEVVHRINHAISNAVGEYIAIQHSDDVWMAEKLERQVAYLDAHPEIGAVFTWVQAIDETGSKIEENWFNRPNQSRWVRLNELFNEKNTLSHPSALVRRRCYDEVGGYRYGLRQIDDAEFWSRLLIRHPIHVLEEKLTQHRLFSDKSNVSGYRPDVAVRSGHEWNVLRENLLTLPGFDEVAQVFPELECCRRSHGFNIKFLLATACVRSPHRSAWPLGLRWLFELLNVTTQRDQIADLYRFTDLSIVELSATLDSYLVGASEQHHRTVAEYETKLQGVLSDYASLQRLLNERDTMLQDMRSEHSGNVERLQEEYARAAHDAQATHHEAVNALMIKVEELRQAQLRKERELVELMHLAEANEARVSAEKRRVEVATHEATLLEAELVRERDERREAQVMGARLRNELDSVQAHAARLEAEWQSEHGRALQAQDLASAAAAKLILLEASSSWRITAPLRNVLAGRPKTARWMRRSAKLIWWSVTLQLFRRLRARRRILLAPSPVLMSPLAAGPRSSGDLLFESNEGKPSALGAVLGDWLTIHHASPVEGQLLFSWLDDLLAYFRSLNVDGDAALLLSAILLDGFRPTMRQRLSQSVSYVIDNNDWFSALVRELEESPVFDAKDYMARVSLQADARQAAIHYLLLGEPLGFAPSVGFNPVYYMESQDDLRIHPCNALIHYIRYGAQEGRQAAPFCSPPVLRPWAENTGRENIIFAVHETSRTGAPILGWNIAKRLAAIYNVFTVRLGGGELNSDFEALSVEVHGPFSLRHANEIDVAYGLRPLFEGRRFKYAIVNSIESRALLHAVTKAGIPTVLLVHEFSSYVWPHRSLVSAYQTASEIVFPAPIVARSALDSDSTLQMRPYHILPQGMSAVPSSDEEKDTAKNSKIQTLAALRAAGVMIVLGAGSVVIRKGVDIFLEVASVVQRRASGRPVHFVWVGGGYRPREDLGYSLYLKEHLNRAGLAEHFTFLDAVGNLEPVYAFADIFLLTSRLDPLPNVTIDAAMRGIPVVCFQDASGMADMLLANPQTRRGVVPHLDSAAAADVIVHLAEDEAARQSLVEATQRYAAEIFNMDHYVAELDRLGGQATVRKIVEAAPHSAFAWWFDAPWYAAQYGTGRDHTGYLTDGLPAGHAPGPLAAQILASFGEGAPFSGALYGEFQRAITWRRLIPRESLRLLIALYVPAWHTLPGLDGFLAYLRAGLAAGITPGPLFDADTYQARALAAGLPPIEPGESAIVHWLHHGVTARIVPTTRFDEAFYRANNPDLRDLPLWGFAHYIEDGTREGRAPNGRPRWYRAPVALPANARLPAAYEAWHEDDFADPHNSSRITVAGEEQLGTMLASPWLTRIYADIQRLEPGIGEIGDITDYLLPPHQDALTRLHAALRARLPAARYQSIICVPWVRTGGADLVAGLLAAALLRIRPDERVLILRTDNPHFERASWLPDAVDCVDMSDLRSAVPEPEGQKLLRVLCRGVAAQRVFNVNSRLCWTTLRDNQANMAASHANYAYLFCWDQTPDGRRVGYPAEFFAETVASVSGFLTDTEYLKAELTAQYRLAPQMQEKIVPLATPAQTAPRPVAIAREIAEARAPLDPCVFWAGRLDRQKRFDLVRDIAMLMPDVIFRCWGAALLDAAPDLTMLPANIVMEGTFESFDALPLADAGVWLFTSSWEGMPTTIIELAMRGVAVVASAVGGVPELITPDTGWPLPPEAEAEDYVAALRVALADPSGAAKRAEALQSRAAERHATTAYDAALVRLLDQENLS
jgi:glycosyltransferase involved in cell wall biosynthesis